MISPTFRAVGAPLGETCLENYFKDIRNTKPLTRDEETALMVRVINGEHGARERLVKANLRFVVSVCRNYEHQGLPLCDLINEGNLGLIRASELFDGNKNFKFISYAVWWIRQGILKALAEQSRLVRLPLNRSSEIYRVHKARGRIEQRTRRPAEPAEIARELGMKESAVREASAIAEAHVSLNAPVNRGESTDLIERIRYTDQESADDRMSRIFFGNRIARSLGKLTDRESMVIRMYFGIETEHALTLESISRHFKLSRERIRQIKRQALYKLKTDRNLKRLSEDH
jgi:RNA polymerase primary sigma factor